jgi:hypothetical protein
VDLIFCRETLQHLAQGDALRALINFNNSGARCVRRYACIRHRELMGSGSRYLMTTTFLEVDDNGIRFDVAAGFYPINLLKPPFNLPQPLRLYIDNTSTREYLGVRPMPAAAVTAASAMRLTRDVCRCGSCRCGPEPTRWEENIHLCFGEFCTRV